jgi:hypothetical protein
LSEILLAEGAAANEKYVLGVLELDRAFFASMRSEEDAPDYFGDAVQAILDRELEVFHGA